MSLSEFTKSHRFLFVKDGERLLAPLYLVYYEKPPEKHKKFQIFFDTLVSVKNRASPEMRHFEMSEPTSKFIVA